MRFVLSAVLYLLLTVPLIGQEHDVVPTPPDADKYADPVEWKAYKVGKKAAIYFPKLPLKFGASDGCEQVSGVTYYAYAQQVIYEVGIFEKGSFDQSYCKEKSSFGTQTYERRLAAIRRTAPAKTTEGVATIGGQKVTIFKWETQEQAGTRFVIPDLENGRWREALVNYRPNVKADADRFLTSFLSPMSEGIDVKDRGSSTTRGDKGFVFDPVTPTTPSSKLQPLLIQLKPRPGYTDTARRSDTMGTVALRVTFLANGGIGKISVISGLRNGLTEQAIDAARRIVFLPVQVAGVPVTAVQRIAYDFSIY